MEYRLIRSRRKTLALALSPEGELTARAPMRMPVSTIEAFILSRQSWILRKRAELQARRDVCAPLRLTDGATMPYRGGALTLRLTDARSAALTGDTLALPRASTVAAFRRWMKAQAALVFAPRVEALARSMGVSVHSVGVSFARTRWGSMTSRRDMRLNAALLLVPPPILDYVIVHELSHIPHPDHSAAFWACVGRALPDYPARRLWLKQHDALAQLPNDGA